jgi:RNA binding exosome subunit
MNSKGSLNRSVVTVEASVFSHATEDEVKVEQALKNTIQSEVAKMKICCRRLSGHYKDPITIMTAKVTRSKDASLIFKTMVQALSSIDMLRILDEIGDRTDESGNLYLRLDKQKAFQEVLTFNDMDSIRVKFSFRIPHGSDPVEYIRSVIKGFMDEGVDVEEDQL